MIKVRKSDQRGHANHGWLDTHHTFSFDQYYDPQFMGFRDLRVINEDIVQGKEGFDLHPHRDMEIITYILDGALEHKDSMGNGSVIRQGDIQRMSAGTGVLHSEFNPSEQKPVHLLQIWILPEKKGTPPGYEQKFFSDEDKRNRLRLIASKDGRDGSVAIQQDTRLYACVLEPGKSVQYKLAPNRHAWIQVTRGHVELNGQTLSPGDGAAISKESDLVMSARREAEVLLFDLA